MKGQGNFGCFAKDTKVKLTDGRSLTFEDLINEWQAGKKNYTYAVNKLGLVCIAEIKKPRLTIKQAELVEVILDNGAKIKCTPNHLFMLKDGSYREAQFLREKESLMPLYEKISEKTDRINRDGYTLIFQNKTEEWVPAHHLADNYNLTNKKYSKSNGRVRHHINFNKLDNSPDNLTRMQWGEHWKIHYQNAIFQHQNKEYRQKIARGREIFWADPANRQKNAERLSERNKKNWQDPIYREKMKIFLSETNKAFIQEHPEKRKEIGERATKTLKRLWQDPEYRFFMHEKIIKGNKNHLTNLTGKKKFLKICKEAINNNDLLNQDIYLEVRQRVYPYGRAPLWETGLSKYFQNNPDLILQEINKNHKVISVRRLTEKEDVFDLTVDSYHNFCLDAGVFVHNSIDGDSASAMRYSEAKLSVIGEAMLQDIEKDTVNFVSNYDATRKEPSVLPSPVPQLLLNGSLGIAVGMATNIPPHNVGEVLDATIYLVDNPEATTEDLFEFVKGPDFPTGGIIYSKKEIISAYSQGKGPILMRGKAEITESKKGVSQIVITEIPYQTQKSGLVMQFAKLVEDKKIDGVKDIRDESDREGMRIVIDLKKEASPNKILNSLYKYTDLQKTFHLNMLALVDGIQPRVLSLSDVLTFYLKHKQEVVIRRTKFDLMKAKERAQILDGLMIALKNIDEVIKTIKQSESKEAASQNLQKKFKLSLIQATAILEMRLSNLAKLEREKIEQELKVIMEKVKELTIILESPKKQKEVVKKELNEAKEKHQDQRRTKVVVGKLGEIGDEDLIPNEEAMIVLTSGGYIKRFKPSVCKVQKRGGQGVTGIEVSSEDAVAHFVSGSTLDKLLFFSDSGKVFQCFVWEIPEMNRTTKGRGILNFLEISQSEKILSIIPYSKQDEADVNKFLIMATKNGIIKKTELSAFKNVRKNGLLAIKLQAGDTLKSAKIINKADEVILITKAGQSIRFKGTDVRSMGRSSSGVKGMKLGKSDEVIAMDEIKVKEDAKNHLLIITENGYGKRTKLEEYRLQKRGGSGIKAAKVNDKTGKVVFSKILSQQENDVVVISAKGQVIKSEIKTISVFGRASSGVRIMKLKPGDKVASAICLNECDPTEVAE
ncbi:MAG: DNA gyrase subunit A [Candidatus Pacebacteria bacterium]|nr:DNA gyrase subunit A [Candidatus Paceibacterota bacterium]